MATQIDIYDHQLLAEQIKAVGRELIRDAENLIPNMEHCTSFSIEIEFPVPSHSGIPELTVMTGVASGKYIDDVIEVQGEYTSKKYKTQSNNEEET